MCPRPCVSRFLVLSDPINRDRGASEELHRALGRPKAAVR
jgi:hypothetical protein